MTDRTVGIAVPFHSDLRLLELCLRSVVAQDDPGWRCVVVDDASPEPGARELVERIGDSRMTYERNEVNLGLAGNFNRCLEAPGTEVVAITHADDVLDPSYVGVVRAAHEAWPHAACVAPFARAIDAAGEPLDTLVDRVKRSRWPDGEQELRGDSGLARLMHAFFVYTPAVSYRPALLPVRFSERWRQVMDVELFAEVLLSGGSIALIPGPTVYRYRRHAATQTALNARSYERLREETQIARELAVRARERGWSRTALAARLRWSVRANGLAAVARNLLGGRAGGVGGALRDVARP